MVTTRPLFILQSLIALAESQVVSLKDDIDKISIKDDLSLLMEGLRKKDGRIPDSIESLLDNMRARHVSSFKITEKLLKQLQQLKSLDDPEFDSNGHYLEYLDSSLASMKSKYCELLEERNIIDAKIERIQSYNAIMVCWHIT